jgi:molybdopterin-guanine dinucleotide biosynthesis protein A
MLGTLILTGGGSSRMGADKAEILWGDRRAIDLVHDLAIACGAARVVTVGGRDYGYSFVADAALGPVGGVLSGAATLTVEGIDRLLVLAVDAPTITPADLGPLLGAADGAAYEGLHLPFVTPIARLAREAQPGWPLARLVERSGLLSLPPPAGAAHRLRGANTPGERDALLKALGG